MCRSGSRACKDVRLGCFLPPSEGLKVSLTETQRRFQCLKRFENVINITPVSLADIYKGLLAQLLC